MYRWQNKVDRSLCERLRAFQSPPPMTGMVMVMTMVLLGRPEFASGIGGAGSFHSTSSREKKGGESLAGGSDEMSRASSATMRRRGLREQTKGSPSQGNLHGRIFHTHEENQVFIILLVHSYHYNILSLCNCVTRCVK